MPRISSSAERALMRRGMIFSFGATARVAA
jgi:hypothetical protein